MWQIKTKNDFRRALDKGLGRAVLHLQTSSSEPHLPAIERAVRRFTGYDAQVEPVRSQYLFDIIQLTGQQERLLDIVLRGLPSARRRRAEWQSQCLVALFAKHGSRIAQEALDGILQKAVSEHQWHDLGLAMEAYGLDGLLWIARTVSRDALPADEHWRAAAWVEEMVETVGEDAVTTSMQENAAADPNVAAFWQLARKEIGKRAAPSARSGRAKPAPVSFSEFCTQVNALPDSAYRLHASSLAGLRWAYTAAESEVARAAAALAVETDPFLLRALGAVFSRNRHRYPGDLGPLLRRAADADETAALPFLQALANVSDPRVRDLALDRMRHVPRKDVIELLACNYQSGDAGAILEYVKSASARNTNLLHWLGMGVLEVYEGVQTPESEGPLTWLYETAPCAHCRATAVDYLIRDHVAAPWLLQECLYDCVLETRQAAERALG